MAWTCSVKGHADARVKSSLRLLSGACPTKPRSEVFVENLIANFIENGRKSIKFTMKFTAKLAKNALLGQALSIWSSGACPCFRYWKYWNAIRQNTILRYGAGTVCSCAAPIVAQIVNRLLICCIAELH